MNPPISRASLAVQSSSPGRSTLSGQSTSNLGESPPSCRMETMTSRTTPSPGAVPRVQPHHADDPHALRPLLDRIGRFMLGNTTKCPTGRWAASWVVVLPPTDHWTRSGPVVLSSDFWNRPLQNWRSEFLAVGSMVVLSITCGNADHRNPNPSEPPTPPPASKAEHTRLPANRAAHRVPQPCTAGRSQPDGCSGIRSGTSPEPPASGTTRIVPPFRGERHRHSLPRPSRPSSSTGEPRPSIDDPAGAIPRRA